jgi:hypothetical protein
MLLNICHLHNQKLLRMVVPEMLAKVAVLVDYYECGQTIELPSTMWIVFGKLSTPIPSTYCRDLIL